MSIFKAAGVVTRGQIVALSTTELGKETWSRHSDLTRVWEGNSPANFRGNLGLMLG